MQDIQMAISRLVDREDLTATAMVSVMHEIMEGRTTPAQIGAFLTALRMKGETVEEIVGAARVMREKGTRIEVRLPKGEPLLDTCGTGGDAAHTFNVSTAAAFVAAGAGVKVAKHGNRSVSSRSGSADVLEALGVDLSLPPEAVCRAVEQIGIGFLFAPALHPAMRHAIGPRREMGIRTVFNVLGPLTNPAGATVQLVGVYDPALTEPLAEVLGRLGSERAWVVHGAGGLDEMSLLGETRVSQWDGKGVGTFPVTPEDVGLTPCRAEDLTGGDPAENAAILKAVLSGAAGPRRAMVLLNAGAAIYLAQRAGSLREGVRAAAESIDSGAAMGKLTALAALRAPSS